MGNEDTNRDEWYESVINLIQKEHPNLKQSEKIDVNEVKTLLEDIHENFPDPEMLALQLMEDISGSQFFDDATPQKRQDITSFMADAARLFRALQPK